jgi:tetratricopeptide (TPR) repeat protein
MIPSSFLRAIHIMALPGDSFSAYHSCLGEGGTAGRWAEAAAAFTRAIEYGDDDFETWHHHLVLRLKAGDLDGYRKACAELVARFGSDGDRETVNFIAWSCALGPDAVADLACLRRSVEAAVARQPRNYPLRNTLGALLYRASQYQEAIRTLDQAVALHGHGGTPFDWLFLAMAHHRLGQTR